jgi:hypothetical protein
LKSFCENDVFSKEDFLELKKIAYEHLNSNDLLFAESYSRYYILTDFPDEIKNKIVSLANQKFNTNNLDIVYTHTVKYQIVDGVSPNLKSHKDNLPATHTLDICIETTMPEWGLNVENSFFPDKPNSVVYLQGDEDIHSRPKYPSNNKDDYCILFLINLAPPEHWGFKVLKSLNAMPEHLKKRMSDQLTPHSRKVDKNK